MMQAKKMTPPEAPRPVRSEAEFTVVTDPTTSPTGEAGTGSAQRRQHARYKVELDVSLGSDHNFYVGFVENISVGGLFIATHLIKEVGEVFELSVHLPDRDVPVHGLGEERWIREYSDRSNVPPGMGIRFLQLEPGDQEAIEAFLSRREPLFYDD